MTTVKIQINTPSDARLEQEFGAIPPSANKVSRIATSCAQMNRKQTYIPYDENRVTLNFGEKSNPEAYINASFCLQKRLKGPIIIADIPHHDYYNAFFQMLYESDCDALFMLLSQNKERYFPLPEVGLKCETSDYEFSVKKQSGLNNAPEYGSIFQQEVILSCVHLAKKNKLSKYCWNPNSLRRQTAHTVAMLAQEVMKAKNPVLITNFKGHLNETVVATVAAYEEIKLKTEAKETIDPSKILPQIVASLRQERGHVFTTLDQYRTLYQALNILLS